MFPDGKRYDVTGTGYLGDGEIFPADEQPYLDQDRDQIIRLCQVATLCNQARLDRDGEGWHGSGDPIDVAFLALSRKNMVDTTHLITTTERWVINPFEADRRYAAAGFIEYGVPRFGMKGAAEAVIPRCTTVMTGSGMVSADQDTLLAAADHLATLGYRVLAVAEGKEPGIPDESETAQLPDMVLLGLVGFIDPVRTDSRDSVAACQKAGVTVVMVTGDHPSTALAIARTLGIASDQSEVLTGADLDAIGSYEVPAFFDLVQKARVFARVTPVQKHVIIDALIKVGNFVAVTIDGIILGSRWGLGLIFRRITPP